MAVPTMTSSAMGSVDDAIGAELVEEPVRHAVSAPELADVLADHVDGVVALHLLAESFTKGNSVKLFLSH